MILLIMKLILNLIYRVIYFRSVKIPLSSKIHGNIKLSRLSKVIVGNSCTIDSLETIGEGKLILEDGVNIKNLTVNFHYGSEVKIGKNSFIGKDSKFIIFSKLIIGEGTLISPEVMVVDTKHIFGKNIKVKTSQIVYDDVEIGSNVWIGAKSIILKGVTIQDNCVIGAMSLVSKDCLKDGVYVGSPAVKVKNINEL